MGDDALSSFEDSHLVNGRKVMKTFQQSMLVMGLVCLVSACAEDQSEPHTTQEEPISTQQALQNNSSPSLRQALEARGHSKKDAKRIAKRLDRFLSDIAQTPKKKSKKRQVDRDLQQLLAAHGGKSAFTMPIKLRLDEIPEDPNNPLTREKVLLGALLFHETGIGVNSVRPEGFQTYSCASCHNADAGFQANRRQGIGDGAEGFFARDKQAIYDEFEIDVQPVRTPSALNTAYQELMLWNGQFGATGDNAARTDRWTPGTPKETNFLGFEGLETQAIAGLGVHRLSIEVSLLQFDDTYQALFDLAFPEVPAHQRITNEHAGLAIAAYERVLLANRAPFQRWLRGDHRAMSKQQVRGAKLFFGKANCVACHSGPALNSMTFHALGMNDFSGPDIFGTGRTNPESLGRGGFTGDPQDLYKFKTPQLYNLTDSPFYGHGGDLNSVREVVVYKNLATPDNSNVPTSQLASEFVPLGLSVAEVNDLTAFLEDGLYDPDLTRYEPTTLLPSGLCTPNNDAISRAELGCD